MKIISAPQSPRKIYIYTMGKIGINQPHTVQNGLRALTAGEVAQLAAQGNMASNWGGVRVAEGFDAARVRRCTFDGYVEIGAFTANDAKYGNLTLKTGLYGSHFRNTSIGDNAAIHNLLYCCEQKFGNSVVVSNVCEISSNCNAAFGMAVDAHNRNAINVINENGGRAILPYIGMNSAGAFLWAKYRDDSRLMAKLAEITYAGNKAMRPPKAFIGDCAVIINTKTIRDTIICSDAVIDGAEFISNSTVMSVSIEKTYIGPAVQIRNSIIGYGNRIDSAAQLENVVTGIAVSIAKAARVAHSMVGDCASIQCCEVSNSLIAPFHTQQHNNSFLISACLGGQSNAAAGATIGSNHNSRACDGEIWAKRGFWPGLCVSLKHNSRFASFTMVAKGNYPAELDVKLPFSLIALDDKTGETVIFPAFWFTHNMYAAMRSTYKFISRDNRIHRNQYVEHDIFAPDTVEEMFEAINLLEPGTVLEFERGRAVQIKHRDKNREMYKTMIRHYCAKTILPYMQENRLNSFNCLKKAVGPIPNYVDRWLDCGGMIITETALSDIINSIQNGAFDKEDGTSKKICAWADVNALFESWVSTYNTAKIRHAVQSLAKLAEIDINIFNDGDFYNFIKSVPEICEQIATLALSSRSKDWSDPFRKMVYQSRKEMDCVLGPLNDPVIKRINADMVKLAAIAKGFLEAQTAATRYPCSNTVS